MAKQSINVGTTANDKKGDSLRLAFQKVNANFTELYTALGLDSNGLNLGAFEFTGSTISTTDSSGITIDQAVIVSSDLTVGGDVLPSVANGGNLGSLTKPFNSLYVSNSTVYFGGIPLSLDNNNELRINNIPLSQTNNVPADVSDLTDTTGLLGGDTGNITFANSTVSAGNEDEIVIQATDDSGFATVKLNLEPVYSNAQLTAYSGESVDTFTLANGDFATGIWQDNGFGNGVVAFTGAQNIGDFFQNTLLNLTSDNVSITINSEPAFIWNGGTSGPGTDTPGFGTNPITPPSPITITSIVFRYRRQSYIGVNYDNQEIRLNAQSADIRLDAENSIRMFADSEIELQSEEALRISAGLDITISNGSNDTINISSGDLNFSAFDDITITGNDSFRIRNDSPTAPIRIITDNDNTEQTWAFNPNGSLTLPGNLQSESDISIDINLSDSTLRRWTFTEGGDLRFPDGTVQPTAYTGLQTTLVGTTVAAVGGTASADETGITYSNKIAIFTEGAFTVGVWTDVQVGWTVTDNNGFTDIIASRGGFGAASFVTTVNNWPAPASGKTYVFTSPDYQPASANPVEITVGNNDWSFNNNGSVTFPDSTVQTTAYTGPQTTLDGDVTGSVFADNSTLMVDGTNGVLKANVEVAGDWTVKTGTGTYTFSYDPMIGSNLEIPGAIQGGLQTGFVSSNGLGIGIDGFNSPNYVDVGNIASSTVLRITDGASVGDVILRSLADATIQAGTTGPSWEFATDGNLTLPGELHGAPVMSIGPTPSQVGRTVNITPADDASDKKFKFRIDQYGETFTRSYLELPTAEVDKQVAAVFPHTNNTAGYIFTQGTNTNDDGMNDAFNIFYNNGDIKITSMGSMGGLYTWKFGEDGDLTIPGDIQSENDINIRVNLTDSTTRTWRFGEDGNLEAPGEITASAYRFDGVNIAIGNGTTISAFENYNISIGVNAGQTSQNSLGIAIGSNAGQTNQGTFGLAIGNNAGQTNQSASGLAIGGNAGQTNQGTGALAIGNNAGYEDQSSSATAVGNNAGFERQGILAVAVGSTAGYEDQGTLAVAVGSNAGFRDQGQSSVAIGFNAGAYRLGQYSVAIGSNAGYTDQASRSISINADVSALEPTTSGFFVNPIRNIDGGAFLNYNDTTKEIGWSNDLKSDQQISITVAGEDSTQKTWYFGNDGDLTAPGGVSVAGILKIEDGVHEKFQRKSNVTGTVEHDCSSGHIFYHQTPDANWTVNLTNLNLASDYATTITLVIEQGATGRIPSAVQVDGNAVPLIWQANTTPTPSNSRIDVVTFSILYDGLYTVLGQLTGF